MGIIKDYRILSIAEKIRSVFQEKSPMNIKVAQWTTLILTLIGTIGASSMAEKWIDHNTVLFGVLVALAQILHALFPSIFGPSVPRKTKNGSTAPLAALVLISVGLFATAANAQSKGYAENLYAAGVSYNVGATPEVAGTALYARNLNTGASLPTYAFTVIDALPTTVKPFTVSTNVGVGIAQQIASFGAVKVWIPTAAGITWNGSNTGWNWNGGVAATIPVKDGWGIMPTIRFLKTSVGGSGNGYQVIPGILISWGK